MNDGISVDANVMHGFTKSYVHDEASQARELVEKIESGLGFAIDMNGKIEQQWLDTCGNRPGKPFFEWFYQRLKEGKIRKLPAKLDQQHKKRLRIDCGFPRDRYEMTYIEVANVTRRRYIVSEDMHFFEPQLKDADESTKAAIKSSRQGRVSRYLTTLGITVGTIALALEEL